MDLQKFLNESLFSRTATVEVPQLSDYFGEDEPAWTVKGLTAAELGRVREASARGAENIKAMIEAMSGTGDKAEAIRKAAGISEEEVPEDVSRRIEMLTVGSVEPKLGPDNRDVAVKLAETFPTLFYQLTDKILSLTGQGAELGKPKRSGKAEKSDSQ